MVFNTQLMKVSVERKRMPEKPTDNKLPGTTQNFVAAHFFEATYQSAHGDQLILIETRTRHDNSTLVFTMIDGQPVRASSIPDLVLSRSDCISLSISHVVPMLWNSAPLKGQLIEVFHPTPNGSHWSVTLKLTIDDVTYNTSPCISLTEAMFELQTLIEKSVPDLKWSLRTCLECKYSFPAFLGPSSDRDELKCYRDASEALTERQQKHKFASSEALNAGAYFVNAFHRCAAWQPSDSDSG